MNAEWHATQALSNPARRAPDRGGHTITCFLSISPFRIGTLIFRSRDFRTSRMLQKSASFVGAPIAALSWCNGSDAKRLNPEGVSPFAKIHAKGERFTRSPNWTRNPPGGFLQRRQYGGASPDEPLVHTKCGMYLFASSLTAAAPVERRVSARWGWAGEKTGLFEHPAGSSDPVHDIQQSCISRVSK